VVAVNDQDYAIVVGINTYPQLRVLRAAVTDATRFAEWLQLPNGGGLPSDNVELIVSAEILPIEPFDAKPIQENIDKALRKFGVERNKRIGRRLYFYFAGHGIGPSFNNVGMLMAHAAMCRLNNNIGLQNYLEYFHEHVLFDELVFILDCCRDHARSAKTEGPAFTPGKGPRGSVEYFVVLAAPYGKKAFEPTETDTREPRGLLTKALLEGLKQQRAADAYGNITASSLREYVRRRVPELAEDAKLRQRPEVSPPAGEILFQTAPPSAVEEVWVRIVAPPGLAGDLILRDSATTEMERRLAVTATKRQPPWEVTLVRNRWYSVEHTADPPGTPPAIIDLRKVGGGTYVFHVPSSR
jgi:Caspase domain